MQRPWSVMVCELQVQHVGMGTGSLWLTNSPQSGCRDLPSSRIALYFSGWQSCIPEPYVPPHLLAEAAPLEAWDGCHLSSFLCPVPHPCRHWDRVQAENIYALCPLPSSSASSIECGWGLGYPPALSFPIFFQPIPWVLCSPCKVLWPVTLTASHPCRFAWNRKNSLREEEPSPAVLQSVLH